MGRFGAIIPTPRGRLEKVPIPQKSLSERPPGMPIPPAPCFPPLSDEQLEMLRQHQFEPISPELLKYITPESQEYAKSLGMLAATMLPVEILEASRDRP